MKTIRPDTTRCYNSGAISSLSYLTAYSNFMRADRIISDELRMNPVNPMNVTWGLQPSAPWMLHMIKDIILLLGCSAIYFQYNWSNSRGARVEHKIAKWLGKDMYFEMEDPGKNKPRIRRSHD